MSHPIATNCVTIILVMIAVRILSTFFIFLILINCLSMCLVNLDVITRSWIVPKSVYANPEVKVNRGLNFLCVRMLKNVFDNFYFE